MRTNRRTILSLIATGKVTPAEAERLLAVCNEQSETLLAFGACLTALLLAQNRHGATDLLQSLQSMLPTAMAAIHHAERFFSGLLGGIL